MKKIVLSALVAAFLFTGCATPMVANLTKHKGHYQSSGNLNKALVYIYREGSFVGSLRGLYIDADGRRVGALNSGTYFVYEADPGTVTISIEDRLGENPSRTLNAEAGKRYYIKGGIKMGLWDADTVITSVTEEEGRGAVDQLVYATMKEKDLK